MSNLRVFLRWCGTIEAVDPNLYTKVMVPKVPPEDQQRDELLESDRAEEILSYLRQFYYASIEHIVLALLWETGMRIGAAKALDVHDVNLDDRFLSLNHRPETGTPLKNGSSGERLVAISPDLTRLLSDHIEYMRNDLTDDAGRKPLLTSQVGRLSRSSMRRYIYDVTAPCYVDEECPDCEKDTDARCPEAVTPHAVRRGSITHFLTEDVPVDVVGDRMDVSRSILDKHYDRRSEEVKLEQRRSHLDNI
ncbi:tyrosine-type recombinase/integrase [Natronococcus wangiae]|uniref:tyrosine-type recombinase/integrase n=1 Tax=Natronococcus wangiae TaxID=3068275 RepID=UPI00273F481C|nr:site-specific integrase [Natronococcus sp. AD5]